MFSVVSNEEFKKISSTKNANEVWTILQNTYEGTKAMKESKLQRLTTSFEETRIDAEEAFDEFYAKLKDIMNSTFNLGEKIPEPKIVRKILRSLLERFHAKITAIEEPKGIDSIPLTELIGNLQTYELGLVRIGKGSKSKNMALKAKNDEEDELSKDENSKFKYYISKQFKKFIKNANVKANDRDHKQSRFSQSKTQEKFKKESKEGGKSSNIPTDPKCYGCQGYEHMKLECPPYLKSIGKSKDLATTLSDTKPEVDSKDSDQEGIVRAFTATVDVSKESEEPINEEEILMESKFEDMNEKDDIHIAYSKLYKNSKKHEKLYRLATRKLSEVEFEREELSIKVNEANPTIGALQFENNFLDEKTKKLDAKLFQVRAQLERTSKC